MDEYGKWQPIETAPMDEDGSLILLYRPTAYEWGKVTPGKWTADKYAKKPRPYWQIWLRIGSILDAREWKPTHWMPLPAPPTDSQQEGK